MNEQREDSYIVDVLPRFNETVMLIATWNVNSLNVRLGHLLDWLDKHKPDVVCIQETKLTDDRFPIDAIRQAGYHSEFFGEKAYNGIAVLSKAEPSSVQKGFPGDCPEDPKRFLRVVIGTVSIICVYVPNGQEVGSPKFQYKLEWLKRLKEFLCRHHNPDELIAICGDFNVALEDRDVYNPELLAGQILFSEEEKCAVRSVMEWGLVDSFRLHNAQGGLYSWWDYRMMAFRRKNGLRIDYICVTEPLARLCARSWIDVEPRKLEKPSDHAPVISEFTLQEFI